MTVDLKHEIRQACTGDPKADARRLFRALSVPKEWADLFRVLVVDEFRDAARQQVLAAERGQNNPETHGRHAPPAADIPNDRTRYLSERFYNGAVYVVWGEATLTDHQCRIEYLSLMRDGIEATIDRHREAVAEIVAAGVTCLNDLDALAGAA
jgi:hypothetical protein